MISIYDNTQDSRPYHYCTTLLLRDVLNTQELGAKGTEQNVQNVMEDDIPPSSPASPPPPPDSSPSRTEN